jgi:hypothetical protein
MFKKKFERELERLKISGKNGIFDFFKKIILIFKILKF